MPNINLGIVCQFSTSNPSDASQTWQDITPYVLTFSTKRTKQRLLQRFEAGTMDISLINTDRRFDPTYKASPYYPYLLPLRQIRLGFVLNGATYWVYGGYIERWPQVYQGPTWAEVDLTCVDGFEVVNNHYLASSYATLTTTFGSNADLTYTAVQLGYVGNSTTITYVNPGGTNTLSVSVSGTDITVNLGTSSGSIISTANNVLTAIQGSTNASALVTVALASGSDGTGVVSALSKTALSGGTFVQQTTGSYISEIFDYVGWNGSRSISTGQSQVQAQAIANDGSTHAIDQIYAAADTEQGQFFFDKTNAPTFLDRNTLGSSAYSTPMITLSDYPDNVTTFGYQDIEVDWDKDLIYNDIRITRLNGSTTIIADDTTSITDYFTRTLSFSSTLNISDQDAKNMAQDVLLKYKQPLIRFEPVKLFPGENATFWQKLLQIDLLDSLIIHRTPPGGGDPIAAAVSVIGIDITVPKGQGPVTNATWSISIDSQSGNSFFVLNDTTFGVLNSNSVGY